MEHDKHPLCSWTQTDRNNRSIFSLTSSILWHNKTNKQLEILNLKEKNLNLIIIFFFVFLIYFILLICVSYFHFFLSFFLTSKATKCIQQREVNWEKLKETKNYFFCFQKNQNIMRHITKLEKHYQII